MNAGINPELLLGPTEAAHEAAVRALRALDENARLVRRTMLAIDQYMETMVRFLIAGGGGAPAARRHATAQGLHRLREYLMSHAARPQPVSSTEQETVFERSSREDSRR
jgi:hypothetical protein